MCVDDISRIVVLRASVGASSRTKNRIRENRAKFIVMSESKTTQFDKFGQQWILFESVVKLSSDGRGGKEAWHGWLPVKEIEVVSE